ncbi:EAL domain-containing protein [Roseibium salinum]|nr:EAL domain-containing protein [Roseibium salinum]
MLFEPQYSLERQQIAGYEALPRWLHPSEGLVDPVRLLSLQEDGKSIAQIERFAVRTGIAEVKRLREAADANVFLSVNLTEASLRDPGFPALISQLCEENDLPAADIVIELDERIIRFDDADGVAWDLGRFSDIGCRIALDMFGSGHGGAGQLLHLKADGVKISPVLIDGVNHSAKQQQLVQSIVGLAGSLGLQVSAVGVDTPEQAALLKALGCSLVQGRVIGQPLSPREAEIHMREFVLQTH